MGYTEPSLSDQLVNAKAGSDANIKAAEPHPIAQLEDEISVNRQLKAALQERIRSVRDENDAMRKALDARV